MLNILPSLQQDGSLKNPGLTNPTGCQKKWNHKFRKKRTFLLLVALDRLEQWNLKEHAYGDLLLTRETKGCRVPRLNAKGLECSSQSAMQWPFLQQAAMKLKFRETVIKSSVH